MKEHAAEKYENTLTFGCEECVYVAIKKSKLGLHKATVHMMEDIVFQCEQCPH